MKKVLVLLSSFNGEKYISQQIETIFLQKNVEVTCTVRDDGSTDGTWDILEDLKGKYSCLTLIKGENIGWKASFCQLVYLADVDAFDYFSFADQDDVWLPEKLEKAIAQLQNVDQNIPALYCSDRIDVLQDLSPQAGGKNRNLPPPKAKESALFTCYAPGCTTVFNKAAKKLFCEYKPKSPLPHDGWMSLLCVYFGKIIYAHESYILYRHHNENVFGSGKANRFELLNRALRGGGAFPLFYCDLYEGYSKYMSYSERKIVEDLLNYKKSFAAKLRILFNKNIYFCHFKGTCLLKAAILFSRV